MDSMAAKEQLRADMTAACASLGEQAPSYSYDVVGWRSSPTIRRNATLSLATWNINSLDIYKIRYVCTLMLQDSTDIAVLIDTRHSAAGLKAYVQLLRERLGARTAVYGSADASRKPDETGGLITIIGPRWGPSYERNASKTDKSGQGVLTSITLRTTTGSLMILATYWPSVPERGHVGEHDLWTRVHALRRAEGARDPDPIRYAQELALS